MAGSSMEKKVEYAIKQIADIHFQAVRGEAPVVVENALDTVQVAVMQAMESVKKIQE
ncbi:hypothetical protein ACWN56_05300 [Weissella viridescens]|uniref:Uncharacterized protein n=1 Tax=Weissella viridescens TaxID=1629 RepID=A0A0R2H119_WEIVI|nr:hypothetical protein [Weissella viridescens]KRN46190.1 hypothetical protein IV50_GL001166 [Weissella viridescens]SUP61378.1 Uncharacterised protein [Weissella viridescens]